jgi:hypothetical protein
MTQNEFIVKYGDLILLGAKCQQRDRGIVKPTWVIDLLIWHRKLELDGVRYSVTSPMKTKLIKWAKKHLIQNGWDLNPVKRTKQKGR